MTFSILYTILFFAPFFLYVAIFLFRSSITKQNFSFYDKDVFSFLNFLWLAANIQLAVEIDEVLNLAADYGNWEAYYYNFRELLLGVFLSFLYSFYYMALAAIVFSGTALISTSVLKKLIVKNFPNNIGVWNSGDESIIVSSMIFSANLIIPTILLFKYTQLANFIFHSLFRDR